MKITEIYQRYPVNQGLKEHMLRVAAVAKQVSDALSVSHDQTALISACL